MQVKNGVYIAKKNKHWAILSKDKQAQTRFKYDRIINLGSDHFALKKNKKWQLADKHGHILSTQKYDSLFCSKVADTIFNFAQKKSKYAVLNQKGGLLTPFEDAESIHYINLLFNFHLNKNQNIIYVSKKNRSYSYCVNLNGKISPKYDFINKNVSKEGYIIVKKGQSWGLIDTEMNEILPLQYKQIERVEDSLWVLQNLSNKFVLFSTSQMKNLTEEYASISEHADQNRIAFSRDSVHFGYLDFDGKVAIPDTFEKVGRFIRNKAVVQVNGKSGIIDTQGKWLLKPTHEALGILSNGNVIIKEECKFTLLNSEHIIISEEYDMIEKKEYSNTYVAVKDGKITYLDSEGKALAPCIFDKIRDKEDHYLIVENNKGEMAVWDIEQQALIIPYQPNKIQYAGNNYFFVYIMSNKDYDKTGILNRQNQWVYPLIYNTYQHNKGEFLFLDNQCFLFNSETGKLVPTSKNKYRTVKLRE